MGGIGGMDGGGQGSDVELDPSIARVVFRAGGNRLGIATGADENILESQRTLIPKIMRNRGGAGGGQIPTVGVFGFGGVIGGLRLLVALVRFIGLGGGGVSRFEIRVGKAINAQLKSIGLAAERLGDLVEQRLAIGLERGITGVEEGRVGQPQDGTTIAGNQIGAVSLAELVNCIREFFRSGRGRRGGGLARSFLGERLKFGFLRSEFRFLFIKELLAGFHLSRGVAHAGLKLVFFGGQRVAFVLKGINFIAILVRDTFILVTFPKIEARGGGKKNGDKSPENARTLGSSNAGTAVNEWHRQDSRRYPGISQGSVVARFASSQGHAFVKLIA